MMCFLESWFSWPESVTMEENCKNRVKKEYVFSFTMKANQGQVGFSIWLRLQLATMFCFFCYRILCLFLDLFVINKLKKQKTLKHL